jgi:hypothetical protein
VKWFVLVGVLAMLALAAACGDDDAAAPTDTLGGLTPAGTKEATPTPLAPDGADPPAGPPVPADPTLDEELAEIASGSFDETIAAGDSWSIDTAAFAEDESLCTNFAFDYTWQVQDPFPPAGVDLIWQFTRAAGTVEVAAGAAGEQSVGCGLLEALNRGDGEIVVAIRYRVGAIQ